MLTVKYISENRETLLERLAVKNFRDIDLIDRLIETDKRRRELQLQMEKDLAELNSLSKEIGQLFQQGKKEDANKARERTAGLKESSRELKEKHRECELELRDLLVQIPNIPHSSVPPGKGEDENVEIRRGGTMPPEDFSGKPHWDLASEYDIIDFELGVKLTGAGFPVYKDKGASLQRALINFFLDEGIQAGYREVIPPIVVNEDSGFGTGQLPDKEGQMYHVQSDNLYLIPTAEVPVTNIYRDVILLEEDFPIKNIAYTPCFRREAGSWGSHVRGLNRLHQFDKVEIVQIRKPEDSYQALEEMVAHVESLVKKLDLPYRIIQLCGGDLSFTSALTYDFEVWSAAQKRWLEVSSVSNFESFQANRLKLRYKEKNDKQPKLAHTLNGSALALPRIVAAIIENNQKEDGIHIPAVLQKYTGFDKISN
jgi:seryl-tRNA synthetase